MTARTVGSMFNSAWQQGQVTEKFDGLAIRPMINESGPGGGAKVLRAINLVGSDDCWSEWLTLV